MVLEWVGDLETAAVNGEGKHVYVGGWIIGVAVDELDDQVLAGDALLELHIPLDTLQILVAPDDRVAVHLVQPKGPLHPLHVA